MRHLDFPKRFSVNTPDKPIILAGDIGGTKTNLGVYIWGEGRPRPVIFESFSSRDAPDLESIVTRFLKNRPASISGACFGVPGPVFNGRVRTTNLPWIVSEDRIQKRFGWPRVRLVNDVTLTATAIPLLRTREVHALNRARVRKDRNMALVAPGTGLGMAMLVFRNGEYIPVPSEGGHGNFAPASEAEIRLWRYLNKQWGHVSIERVVSGPGLVHIYTWLKKSGLYREPAYMARMIKDTDPAAAITRGALEYRGPICRKALEIFVSILGRVCGDLCLTGLTTGGLYLGGGIPPRILPAIKSGGFMRAFTDKGRFKGIMEKIPVRVILNDKAALLGAAHQAFETAGQS
jgi:glucokinase